MTATLRPATAAGARPSAPATYESVLRDLALADERIVVLTAENRAAIRSRVCS
ncbi:MAG TPA: hypothetical protein VMT93_08515 [Gemmatimonadaceae bacterium]|nr:hypothetical protein [Gemmatimonadaceae bacterium]